MVQGSVDNWTAKTKREYLAFTIAETFNDVGQIKLYTNYCKKYPLILIQRAFAEAKSFPEERIKKSRAAIFFYLLKTYAHQAN
jgi:hypothetical protein